MYRLALVVFITLAFSACNKDDVAIQYDKYGVITSLPFEWDFPLHKNGTYSNSIIEPNLVYENKIIVATTEGPDDRWITLVNTDDGETLWKWNDIYQAPTEKFSIVYAYFDQNLMTYQVGSRSYCINLDNGNTHWKIRRDNSFDSEITGLGDAYYVMGPWNDPLDGHSVTAIYKGHMNTGDLEFCAAPSFSRDFIGPVNFVGAVTNVVPYLQEGDTMLLMTYAEPLPDWHVNSFIALYNASTDEWVYDRILLAEPAQNSSVFHPPVIYNQQVVSQVGTGLVSTDLESGMVLWSNMNFQGDFLFSGFIIEDGLILANNEDGYLYALNLYDGSVVWKERTAGTSSRLRYLNGVVYLSGGSTGRIHAVDTDNGRTVWRLDPEAYPDGSDDFKPDIYTIPEMDGEKGKVVVLTHKTAYCLEAYR